MASRLRIDAVSISNDSYANVDRFTFTHTTTGRPCGVVVGVGHVDADNTNPFWGLLANVWYGAVQLKYAGQVNMNTGSDFNSSHMFWGSAPLPLGNTPIHVELNGNSNQIAVGKIAGLAATYTGANGITLRDLVKTQTPDIANWRYQADSVPTYIVMTGTGSKGSLNPNTGNSEIGEVDPTDVFAGYYATAIGPGSVLLGGSSSTGAAHAFNAAPKQPRRSFKKLYFTADVAAAAAAPTGALQGPLVGPLGGPI